MTGYAKEQLEAKGANVARYILCSNCSLYWHKRVFKRHLEPPLQTRAAQTKENAIIHPAWADFIDFLAEGAVEHFMEDQAEKLRRGEPLDDGAPKTSVEKAADAGADAPEALTVDEAVARLGISRDEILAAFEKNRTTFEVTIPAASPRVRGRAGTKLAPKS